MFSTTNSCSKRNRHCWQESRIQHTDLHMAWIPEILGYTRIHAVGAWSQCLAVCTDVLENVHSVWTEACVLCGIDSNVDAIDQLASRCPAAGKLRTSKAPEEMTCSALHLKENLSAAGHIPRNCEANGNWQHVLRDQNCILQVQTWNFTGIFKPQNWKRVPSVCSMQSVMFLVSRHPAIGTLQVSRSIHHTDRN